MEDVLPGAKCRSEKDDKLTVWCGLNIEFILIQIRGAHLQVIINVLSKFGPITIHGLGGVAQKCEDGRRRKKLDYSK